LPVKEGEKAGGQVPLTVLRGSPEKPCAGFSPGKHLGTSANFDRPTAISVRRSGRRASFGDPAGGARLADLLDSRSLSAVAALAAAYKRAADAWRTLPTSHNCRGTSSSGRPLSSSSIAEKLPAGRAPDHTPIIAWCALSSGGPSRAARRLAGLVKAARGQVGRAAGDP